MARVANPNTYRAWRKRIMARDNYKCTICGSTERLEADHIKPFSKFPELRYDDSNGRVLCHDCHKKTDTYGAKQLKGTRRDGNPYGTN